MTESFDAFTKRVGSFEKLSPTDKICHAAWYLHQVRGSAYVTTSSINGLFSEIHLVAPPTSVYLKRLSERKPPVFIKSKQGFRLENRPRKSLDEKFSGNDPAIHVGKLLSDLVDKLPDQVEAEFLRETLRCYSVKAFRASIVMAWNLAYSHLTQWIVNEPSRIASFNNSIAVKYPKKNIIVSKFDDFADLKEFETIEVCQNSKLISKNVSELMKEKLKRRNSSAHPSNIIITQAQADDVITDLVNNVVLKL